MSPVSGDGGENAALDPMVPVDAASDERGEDGETIPTAFIPPIPTGDMVWVTFWMGLDYMVMLTKSWLWTIFCRAHFAKFVWPKPRPSADGHPAKQPWASAFFQVSYLPDDWQVALPGFRFGTWFLFGCYIRILPVWIDLGIIRARRVPKPVVAQPLSAPVAPQVAPKAAIPAAEPAAEPTVDVTFKPTLRPV